MKLNLSSLPGIGRLAGGLLLAATLALPPLAAPVHAQASDWTAEHWVGTWGAGPGGPPAPASTLAFTSRAWRTAGGTGSAEIMGLLLLSGAAPRTVPRHMVPRYRRSEPDA